MKHIHSYLLISATVLISSCKKDDTTTPSTPAATTPTYTVPSTYTFTDSSGASTVSFSGQTQRLAMLSEMVGYMKTTNTAGTAISADTLKKMYNNGGYVWADAGALGLFGSSKQLKSKTAGGDAGVQATFEAYMDSIAKHSMGSVNITTHAYDSAGVWTNGTKSYLQASSGLEYGQLIEKGLMCAVFLNQMTNNYLAGIKNDDNTTVVAGKTYTQMQHHWDEAYGYLTSEITYPAAGTDRFWGKYVNGREAVLGSATTLSEAFRKGRAAIDNNDTTTRNAQIVIINDAMEKVCAGTAIHYLNGAKADVSDATLKNHQLSEAIAFLNGLRYGDNSISGKGMSATDINTALAYIGTDLNAVTITNINLAIDLIAAKTGLTSEKASL